MHYQDQTQNHQLWRIYHTVTGAAVIALGTVIGAVLVRILLG